MLSPVSAVGSSYARADRPFVAQRQDVPTVADKTRLAGAALERSKRELAAAQLQVERQDQQIADARRELERLRWFDASGETGAEADSAAAAAAIAQNAAIDAAVRAGADTNARVLRLQGRIERQTARYLDLMSRLRATESPEKDDAR